MSLLFTSAKNLSYVRFLSHHKYLYRNLYSYTFRDSCRFSSGKVLYAPTSKQNLFENKRFSVIQNYDETIHSSFYFRPFHTSNILQESKVEGTLEALKDTLKNEQQKKEQALKSVKTKGVEVDKDISKDAKPDLEKTKPIATTPPKDFTFIETPPSQTTTGTNMKAENVKINLVPQDLVVHKPPIKLSLTTRFINELKHYYHGFKLLFIDVRVSLRLIWAVLNGKTLMRREKKQLVRTTADLFRLVPFLVFILIPFAEFALPLVLKFFPGMLPSTFKEADAELIKKRKRLKLKLELAKFLQDTLEETALQRKGAKGESVHEFVRFMEQIRTSGFQTSNTDIMKFSKLFEDEITLDNLDKSQLRAMCQMLEITPVISSSIMRFQLEMKLRDLKADDKMIQKEGIDSMAVWELQEACKQRGMRSLGVPEGQLKQQLEQWLDLHLNLKIPPSLLILSRTLFLHDHISTEEQLKATILSLPASLDDEAKVKISEMSGDRIDNKSKLEVIRQEEELIKKEKIELEMREKKEKAKEEAKKETMEQLVTDINQFPSLSETLSKDEIHTKDLEELEEVLEQVVDSKLKMHSEVAELRELKDEFVEYKENLDQIRTVVGSSVETEVYLQGLEETKAAKRLTKKVENMIEKLNQSVEKLSAENSNSDKTAAVDEKVSDEPKKVVEDTIVKPETSKEPPILDATTLIEKQATLITVNELLIALRALRKDEDTLGKLELMGRVLDTDQDGLIDYKEATKLLKMIGDENMRMNSDQVTKIMQTLEKEKEILENEKLKKQQEDLLHEMQLKPEQQNQHLQQKQYSASEEHNFSGSVAREIELQKFEELRQQHRQKQLQKQQDSTVYDQIMLQKQKLERQQKQLQTENKNKPQ